MGLSIGILFLFLPLIYLPGVFNPYEFPKFIVFVAAVLILIMLSIGRFWSPPRFALSPQNDGKLKASKLDLLAVLMIVYGLVVYIANIFGIDPKTSFLGSPFRHQGFITLLAGIGLFFLLKYNFYNGYKNYKDYIRWILLGAFLVSVIAIWQGINVYIFHNLTIPTYQGRIVGTMGNPNSLAGYLAIVLPFVLFNKNKIIKLVLSLMIVAVVILTDSRSAFLAVGFIFAVYGIRRILKLNISRIAKVFIIVLIFVGIVKFVDYSLHKNTINNQAPVISERGCPESWPIEYPLKFTSDIYNSKIFYTEREALCDNRFLIGVVGLQALSKRPILGYGQENFEIAVSAGKMHAADNAHNIFLETAMSSGLIGLFIFLEILFIAFKKSSFVVRMSLLSFLIIAQFNPLSIVEIMLLWFLLGLVHEEYFV